jgi:bifunctional DNA-binding transcriptional regulator/antitoxin component of YhaV-PrlF toxin-antitoxin module
MADYCAPFAECTGLDSRLLINRTVYGPALAIQLAEIPFGPVVLDGASLHSSVTWSYEQTWSAREACCGPVRSVFGLAPGETVTLEVRRREEVEVTDLVQSAMESSEVRTRLQGERRPRPSDARTKDQLKEQMEKIREMQTIAAKSMSSPFLEFIIAAAVADEVSDAVAGSDDERKDKFVDQVSQMHEHENGSGAGTINGDTLASIDSILERVEVSESRNSFAETRTSEKTVTEQMLRRTFSNPYRDRTLELRFIPVFRRFEVRTRLVGSEPGIFFKPGAHHSPWKVRAQSWRTSCATTWSIRESRDSGPRM